jgi:crotonobetainyl-CoA:carnitine CoA-transferase CaiB-like acyl-CoA transferase
MGTESRPLHGVRVLELAQWVFVPSASAILAELGADVVRIEHPTAANAASGSTSLCPRARRLRIS